MQGAVAYSNDNQAGLTDEDIRTATALIHGRFRGHFSGIARERSGDGAESIVVMGTRLVDEPLMTIERANGTCVIRLAATGQVFEADTVDEALNLAHDQLPRATTF